MKNLVQNSNGGAVFWKTAPSLRSQFAGLAALGLDSFIPPQRTEEAMLHDALGTIFSGPTTLVRRLEGQGGFTVVEEERGDQRNRYTTRCSAKWADGKLEVDAHDAGQLHGEIMAGMKDASDRVSALSVTQSLVKLVEHLGGVALRPSGAIYWLLNGALETWQKAAPIYEAAAEEPDSTAIYVMKTVADAGAIDAVCDALATDTARHVADLNAEIQEGKLGPGGLRNRAIELEALRRKLTTYEGSLGTSLAKITQMVEDASTATAQAIVLASARVEQTKAAKAKP